MKIKQTLLKDLPIELVSYLQELELTTDPTKKAAIPVYYKEGRDVSFISDYVLRYSGPFEKSAPSGLYRGGGLLDIVTRQGHVVVYDESPNAKWLRLVGGIARFSEGGDLVRTAIREAVVEELAVLDKKETVRLVPEKTKDLVGLSIPGWGITVEGIVETGALMEVNYFFNDANRAFEVVVQWDLCSWDDLIILHSEDWFKGGLTGFAPQVIDPIGDVVGYYDGRHGYVPYPVQNLHPTLEAILHLR